MSLSQELAAALTMPTSEVQGVWTRAPSGDNEPLSQLNVASVAAEAAFDAMYVTVQLYTCAAAKCCNVLPAELSAELAMPIGDAKRAVSPYAISGFGEATWRSAATINSSCSSVILCPVWADRIRTRCVCPRAPLPRGTGPAPNECVLG